MPPTATGPKYSLMRYWRYVFVPLVVILIGLAWYVIFIELSPVQLSVGSLPKLSMDSLLPAATAPALNAGTAAAAAMKPT